MDVKEPYMFRMNGIERWHGCQRAVYVQDERNVVMPWSFLSIHAFMTLVYPYTSMAKNDECPLMNLKGTYFNIIYFGHFIMNVLTSKIEQFFNVFIDGFKTNDIKKLQACYHLPCTLNTPEYIDVITNNEQLSIYFQVIFSQLEQEQFSHVNITNTHYTVMANDFILACVDWSFIDNAGIVFSNFSAFYHLSWKNEQLTIMNATSHNSENSQKLAIPFQLEIKRSS
jgi:hypothetical protein